MKTKALVLSIMLFGRSRNVFALTYDPETGTYILDSKAQDQSSNKEQEENDDENTVSKSVSYDWPLEDLHRQLDKHQDTVRNHLSETLKTIEEEGATVFSDNPDERLSIITCLDLIDAEVTIKDDVEKTYDQLLKESEIVATDLHSEISSLEAKMEQGLLSELSQNITLASLQNKVDAYVVEYTNVVDMFYELSREDVAVLEEELKNAEEDHADVLNTYDARRDAYDDLEEEYAAFLEKASFSSVLAGPNIQELVTLVDGIETYARSLFSVQRQKEVTSHVPLSMTQDATVEQAREKALNEFAYNFNLEAQKLLGDIYPVESLQSINKSIVTLRSAYMKNGLPDCKAFANNPTLDVSAPQLIASMDNVLATLNEAAQKVATDDGGLPLTLEALKEGVVNDLGTVAEEVVDTLIAEHKEQLQGSFAEMGRTWMSIPLQTTVGQVELLVRTYLQKKYKDALQDDELASFQSLLSRAEEKVDGKLSSAWLSSGVETVLLAVQRVLQEFN